MADGLLAFGRQALLEWPRRGGIHARQIDGTIVEIAAWPHSTTFEDDAMSARYPAPGTTVPNWSASAVPVLPLDDAHGQRITLTGSSQAAAALPEGCDLALVTNLGADVVHVSADGTSPATNAMTPIPGGGRAREIVVTAADRIIRLIGTGGDAVVIVPFLPAG